MQEITHRNGFVWTMAEDASPSHLEALIAAFPDLDAVPGVRMIKRNHFRAVYEVPPGVGGTPATSDSATSGFLAKVYRYTSRWDRLRFRLIRARAEQEWVALSRFRELGLATARPVAVAVWRDGERLVGGGLLASFLGGTEALGKRLHRLAQEAGDASAPPGVEAAHILTATGQYLRRLHEQGVWHRDLHGGNFLVSEDGEKLYLIDLHTCVFVGKLARWQARRGVIKLLHSLQFSVPREWLRLLLENYGWGRLYLSCAPTQEEARLFLGAERLERTRLRSRAKRCFKPSTRFEVKRSRGVRYYRLRARDGADWAASELESIYRRSSPEEVIKQNATSWVARVPTPTGEPVCVKYRRLSLLESVQALVESHRLRRAYAAGHAFWVHNIPTPQVLALREHRTLGLVREAYLVTEFIPDSLPLDQFLKQEYWGRRAPFGDEARARHRLALRVGNLVRKVHCSGFYPHDFSPQNVLVTRQALVEDGARLTGLQLVDLDHLYLWQPLLRRGRRKNLVQLGNLCEGHVGVSDRLRALRAYCDGVADSPYCQPDWIRELDRRLLLEHRRVLDELVRQENEASR
jgi:tRNA A-37 threonylcarbamoyl transferase component Bud32